MLFGTTGTAQALGASGASPHLVGGARIALGGVVLAFVALARGRVSGVVDLFRAGGWGGVAVGSAGVAAYQLCFFSAVSLTGVAVGTLVAIGSGPVLAGVFGLAVGERPDGRWAAATALAIAGTAVLVLAGRSARVEPSGVLLAVGAGASYAALAVAGRWLAHRGAQGEDVMTAYFGGAALLLLPFWIGLDKSALATPSGLAMIAWLGLFATAAAYLLFGRGLTHLPAATITTLTLAEPLTATLLAVTVLGERPSMLAWWGAGLVAAGLVFAAFPRSPGVRTL